MIAYFYWVSGMLAIIITYYVRHGESNHCHVIYRYTVYKMNGIPFKCAIKSSTDLYIRTEASSAMKLSL